MKTFAIGSAMIKIKSRLVNNYVKLIVYVPAKSNIEERLSKVVLLKRGLDILE